MTRTRRADGDVTRAKILEAAGRLIAARGFAHTTSKQVAEAAGTDLAAINYHFGSRDGLYLAVLVEGHGRLFDLEQLRRLAQSPMAPGAKLTALLDTVVRRLLEQPSWHAPVFAREILSPSPHLHALVQDVAVPKFQQIRKILCQVTQIRESDPAILRCFLSVMAPCLMLLVARGAPGPMQQVMRMDPAILVEHLSTFALAGLDAVRKRHGSVRQRRGQPRVGGHAQRAARSGHQPRKGRRPAGAKT